MIYQSIYDLINTYIFNNTVVAGTYPELVTILLSTVFSIGVMVLPFVVVYKCILMIMNVWGR